MRYKLGMEIQAEVVDDRLKKTVDAAQKELQEQAAAYVDFVLREHLLEKLTKAYGRFYPSAQLAQIAVDILVEELKHIHLELPGLQARLQELKDANPPQPALPAPKQQLPKDETDG